MLPSGNDAAQCLAENFGYLLRCEKKNKTGTIERIRASNNLIYKSANEESDAFFDEFQDNSGFFIKEMN